MIYECSRPGCDYSTTRPHHFGRHLSRCPVDAADLTRLVGAIRTDGGCLLPTTTTPGTRAKVRGGKRAHIVSLEIRLGRQLLPGMVACHACDVPNCVESFHLWEGTQQDNLADMRAKGRANHSGLALGRGWNRKTPQPPDPKENPMSKNAIVPLKRSWLVQRLNPPLPVRGGRPPAFNPFAFGGGYRDGGLGAEAVAMLAPICDMDYMGSAEFEFGAFPKALAALATGGGEDLTTSIVRFPLSNVPRHWQTPKGTKPPAGEGKLYVLARTAQLADVEARLAEWVLREPDLKAALLLHAVLTLPESERPRVEGWLELDNGFMFFVDRIMWANIADLFNAGGAVRDSEAS